MQLMPSLARGFSPPAGSLVALVTLGAAAVACGGGGGAKVATTSNIDPAQDVGAGLEELRRDLESTVLENYSHLSLGNIGAYADNVASDAPIALLGPRSSDLVTDDSPFRERRDRRLYSDRDVQIFSKHLEMHLSDDGATAWVADELSYRVPYDGREAALPLRYTAVLVRQEGRWVIRAEHMSYPLAADRVITLARGGSLHKLRNLGSRVETGAGTPSDIAEKLHDGRQEVRRAHASAAESSLWWLPGPGSEYRGTSISEAPPVASLFGDSPGVERGGVIAAVTQSETIAWVAEHLFVRIRAFDETVVIPLRALYVFEKTGADWQVVQAHYSVALENEQINQSVFGEKKLSDRRTRR